MNSPIGPITSDLQPYRAATLQALTALSEAILQARIVEPLLRLMGFENVRDTSGANDKGKDLVATKLEFGKPKLYAIQIKKFVLSGKHTKTNALTNVVTQLRQTMLEPVIDPFTKQHRVPDRGVFITPFAISRDALASALEQVRELERREITIIDGPLLVDLVLKHLPEAIVELDAQLKYRVHLAKSSDRIPEAAAFNQADNLSIDDLFVEVSVIYGTAPLKISGRHDRTGSKIVDIRRYTLSRLRSLYESYVSGPPRIWVPPRSTRGAERKQIESAEWARAEIDLDPLIESMNKRLQSLAGSFAAVARSAEDRRSLNPIIAHSLELTQAINSFLSLDAVRDHWPELVKHARATGGFRDTAVIATRTLVDINHPVVVTGEPGGGKTTLLRRIAQHLARTSPTLPVLIQLVNVPHPEESDPAKRKQALVNALLEQGLATLSRLGYPGTRERFLQEIDEGGVRLLLDGLDESGSAAPEMFAAIQEFSSSHPACPIVVTCRDTLSLAPWQKALHLQLHPFSDSQLEAFISHWFHAEPSARYGLGLWLDANPRMKAAARTPIIAALLCSLHHAEAEMPTTEVELYSERFSLLLGKWERVKGIEPLSPRLRQRYWHFLMELAKRMHDDQARSIPHRTAVDVARQFDLDGIDADAIVMDCVHRGIFLRESSIQLSFGHLTYQEFMVAKWLSHNNPISLILDHMEHSWWTKAIEFYAAIHGDISALIDAALSKGRKTLYRPLTQLSELAPLTPRSTVRALKQKGGAGK